MAQCDQPNWDRQVAPGYAGGIKRCYVLQVAHAAQILPEGVLEPAFADTFIAKIVGVFEVVQETMSRVLMAGRPLLSCHMEANACSKAFQSIRSASLTIAC